jgi:hypothetical protein
MTEILVLATPALTAFAPGFAFTCKRAYAAWMAGGRWRRLERLLYCSPPEQVCDICCPHHIPTLTYSVELGGAPVCIHRVCVSASRNSMVYTKTDPYTGLAVEIFILTPHGAARDIASSWWWRAGVGIHERLAPMLRLIEAQYATPACIQKPKSMTFTYEGLRPLDTRPLAYEGLRPLDTRPLAYEGLRPRPQTWTYRGPSYKRVDPAMARRVACVVDNYGGILAYLLSPALNILEFAPGLLHDERGIFS